MGGCATKPQVLKDEAEVPKPAEEPSVVADEPKAETAAVEQKEEEQKEVKTEVAEGQKSLGNLFQEKEAEENATAEVTEEKPKEETEIAPAVEEAKLEQTLEEVEKALEVSEVKEASEVKAETAVEEKAQ